MQQYQVVIGTASADKALLALAECCPGFNKQKSFSRKFTPLAEKILYQSPLIVFCNKSDLGAPRICTESDTLSLLGRQKFAYQQNSLKYLSAIPMTELSGLTLTFVFLPYNRKMKVAEHLYNMLLYLENIKEGSRSGKQDYLSLERELKKLIEPETVASLIPLARKHSYIKVLNTKSEGGDSHAK